MSTLVERGSELAVSQYPMSPFARAIYEQKYAWKDENGNVIEDWPQTAERVVKNVLGSLGYEPWDYEYTKLIELITERKFLPGGRYLYASGRGLHQTQNCLLMRCEDTREGWAELLHNASMALMTGAGIGIDYSRVRPQGTPIKQTGGLASGPLSPMQMVNEVGRHVMQGGSRRSAIWAGLNWKHGDIFKFIDLKLWSPEVRALKERDFNFPATMDMTNISVLLDDEFFAAYDDDQHHLHNLARDVYHLTVKRMVKTGEPGFSIDIGENADETLRNACTEVTSSEDSDVCNLGSINLANIDTLKEMEEVTRLGTLFLLAGTIYSDLPYDKVYDVREKNRRLGLGVMGIHEWLLKRGLKYEANDDLGAFLKIYSRAGNYAAYHADRHDLRRPIKTRAIAPTGTIGIIAETTTGIEPIYCVAFKRRYLSGNQGNTWKYQYVVDPTAARLINQGIDPNTIEDAYSLSYDVERRIRFQSWVQSFVDHGISSTVNLPYPITDHKEVDDFANMLYPYLPTLRGVTVYPDGARGGQPLSVCTYEEAIGNVGVIFEESEERCVGGQCGV